MEQSSFSTGWASASDIGERLGLSALAVHKALEDAGLWDAPKKEPTERALAEGWVLAPPLQAGHPHIMWSAGKVGELLRRTESPLSKAEIALETFVREILRREREAAGAGEASSVRSYIVEELPRYRGTSAEVVAAVCQRLGIASRTDEFVALVAPAETSRTASTLTGQPEESRGPQ